MSAVEEPTQYEEAPREPGPSAPLPGTPAFRPLDDGTENVPGYRDLVQIGHGGFSVVYRARQEAFDRTVALKVLTVPSDETVRLRFLREVKLTGRLTGHPHVVTALDAGMTRAGRPFLAMDLYERGSLRDRLTAEGPLPLAEVVRIGAKIADALSAAHEVGVLHRDVKPNNILVSPFGEPALADFGVSCLLDTLASSTVLDAFSPHHAAPEVVSRGVPSAASDVYSLGSTLHQLLCGTAPFGGNGEAVVAVLWQIVNDPPPRLDLPELPALSAILAKALAKDPAHRFPSAAAFADALRTLNPAGASQGARPPVAGPAMALAAIPASPASDGNTPRSQTPPTVPWAESVQAQAEASVYAAAPVYATDSSRVYSQGDSAETALRPDRVAPVSKSMTAGERRKRRWPVFGGAAAGVAIIISVMMAVLWSSSPQGAAARHGAAAGLSGSGSSVTGATGSGVAAPEAGAMAGGGVPVTSSSAANAAGGSSGRTGTGGPTGGSTRGTGGSATPSASPSAVSSNAATTSPSPSPVSTSCSWSNKDPHPGSYGYMSGSFHLQSGPYGACTAVALLSKGTKFWYHCYVTNAYGHIWIYGRVSGAQTFGWMLKDNLTGQVGTLYKC
jgi:serine/threonine protein kinase